MLVIAPSIVGLILFKFEIFMTLIIYDEIKVKSFNTLDKYKDDIVEGYVVRNSNEYLYNDSNFNIAKFVSGRFVIKSDKHWALNGLKRNKISAV